LSKPEPYIGCSALEEEEEEEKDEEEEEEEEEEEAELFRADGRTVGQT